MIYGKEVFDFLVFEKVVVLDIGVSIYLVRELEVYDFRIVFIIIKEDVWVVKFLNMLLMIFIL